MTAHDRDLPRHRQRAITIRSDKAAKLLVQLTRSGRSQAEIVEEALAAMPLPATKRSREERLTRFNALVATFRPDPGYNMAQFDEETYDENGLPR